MTLGTTHSVVSYEGDGATIKFGVTFEFLAATDLEVILVTVASGVERVQTQGFHYQVEGGDGGLGQIRFTDSTQPPASGERVVIRRISSDLQPDDLRDGGALAAEPLERRLDIITARLQELETDVARSLKVAKGSMAPESGLTLNLTGGMGAGLRVADDELGIITATATVPDNVATSPFGETWVGLADEVAGRSNLGLTSAATTALGASGATIPLLNGANTYSGASTFSEDATFNSNLIVGAPFVLQSEILTIDAGGQIAPTKSDICVNNNSGAPTDNLDTIAVTNHPVGAIIELRAATAGQVPTLRHAQGGGNIYLAQDTNAVLDDRDKTLWLQRRDAGEHGAGWYEVGRSFSVTYKQWRRVAVLPTTSGTFVQTGIAGAPDMIRLAFLGVSVNALGDIQVIIGDVGAFAVAGKSHVGFLSGNSVSETPFFGPALNVTNGRESIGAIADGVVDLVNGAGNFWQASGNIGDNERFYAMAGTAQLNGPLTSVRINTTAGNFDNGSVTVWAYS